MSEDDPAQPTSQTASTVERAADVLVLFAESATPTLGVTEIADRLSLSKAAVHRILASLRSRQLIELDEETRRYSLGVMSMRLGLAYLDRIDIRGVAAPELAALSAETGETATLSVRSGKGRIYVEQVTPAREVRMSVTLGVPYPLHIGASSRYSSPSCRTPSATAISRGTLPASRPRCGSSWSTSARWVTRSPTVSASPARARWRPRSSTTRGARSPSSASADLLSGSGARPTAVPTRWSRPPLASPADWGTCPDPRLTV